MFWHFDDLVALSQRFPIFSAQRMGCIGRGVSMEYSAKAVSPARMPPTLSLVCPMNIRLHTGLRSSGLSHS